MQNIKEIKYMQDGEEVVLEHDDYFERDNAVRTAETTLLRLCGFEGDVAIGWFEGRKPRKGLVLDMQDEEQTVARMDGKELARWVISCRGGQWQMEALTADGKHYKANDEVALIQTEGGWIYNK